MPLTHGDHEPCRFHTRPIMSSSTTTSYWLSPALRSRLVHIPLSLSCRNPANEQTYIVFRTRFIALSIQEIMQDQYLLTHRSAKNASLSVRRASKDQIENSARSGRSTRVDLHKQTGGQGDMMSALPCSGVRTTATAQRKLRRELRGLLRTQTVCRPSV